MEGSRRFGMAVMTNVMERETREVQRKVHPIATEVEITDCQLQPDGRYYLEIKASAGFAPRCGSQPPPATSLKHPHLAVASPDGLT